MFRFATSQTHFYFDRKIFDQVDGVVMFSPLGSALGNVFMGYNQQNWLESDRGRLVKFYHRYVDNIFCVFENEYQALTFLAIFKQSTPKFKLPYRKRTYGKTPIFGRSQYLFKQINY